MNQHPEQMARDRIDAALEAVGWVLMSGVAVKEYQTDIPESLGRWIREERTLRARLHELLALPTDGLRDWKIEAITNLDVSFKQNRPRALIQMATGSGKTFTAITFIYRLLKFARARRVLFLVDTKNLGEQAEQDFRSYERRTTASC